MAKKSVNQVEGETVEVKGAPELSAPIQPSVPESLRTKIVTKKKKRS